MRVSSVPVTQSDIVIHIYCLKEQATQARWSINAYHFDSDVSNDVYAEYLCVCVCVCDVFFFFTSKEASPSINVWMYLLCVSESIT